MYSLFCPGLLLNGKNILLSLILVPFKTLFSQRGNRFYLSKIDLSIQICIQHAKDVCSFVLFSCVIELKSILNALLSGDFC